LKDCASADVAALSSSAHSSPGCGMRAQAEDGQFTCNQHFCDELLIFAPLKIRAGMNCVPAGPARRSDQRVQTICVRSLVRVGHNLATRRPTFARVGDAIRSPMDETVLPDTSNHFLALCRSRCQGSGDACVARRWSKPLHCVSGDICWVIGVSVGWTHDSSPFVTMCRNLPNISEWNIPVHNFAGASVGRLVLILVVLRTLVVAAAVFPRAEQQQVVGAISVRYFLFPLCLSPSSTSESFPRRRVWSLWRRTPQQSPPDAARPRCCVTPSALAIRRFGL
jgi:hypothetical protein